jgi:hypothetical protein
MRRRAVLTTLVLGLLLAPAAAVICESFCVQTAGHPASDTSCHRPDGPSPVTLSAPHTHVCDHIARAVGRRAIEVPPTAPGAPPVSLHLARDRWLRLADAVRSGSPPGLSAPLASYSVLRI